LLDIVPCVFSMVKRILGLILNWFAEQFYRYTLAGGLISLAYMVMAIKPPMLARFPAYIIFPIMIAIGLVFSWFLDKVLRWGQRLEKEGRKRSGLWEEQFTRMDDVKAQMDRIEKLLKSLPEQKKSSSG
jgi:hypothetical protein